MPHKRTSSSGSMKSIASHHSLTELFGSSINSISVGVSAGVNSIGSVTINTISTISTKSHKPKSQFHDSKQGISTELCMPEFKNFLCHTLSKQVQHSDDLDPLYDCLEAENMLHDELCDMELGLKSVLKSNPNLPSKVVGQVHTFLGMVYLELDNNTAAVDAFMRAIWFISRDPEDKLAIAQANHRLGLAYGRKKDYQQAMDLIDRAIQGYEPSSNDYVTAQEDRHEFMEAQQLDLLAKAGRLTKAVADSDTKNRRASRRKRIQDRAPPKRQRSFNKGLSDALKAINPVKGPAFQRQATSPASLSRQGSSESIGSASSLVRRQSTSPMP